MTDPRPGEDDLIARYFRPLAGPGALGLLDDAACFEPPPGRAIVATVDAIVAGIHFFPDDPPEAIGWKALAVNMSDLAAKGAVPLGFLLTLALPADWTPEFLAGFSAGLGACAAEGACPLLGGDTVRTSGPLTLSVTALGHVAPGKMAARTGAKPGDAILVTGSIGDAALGLALRLGPDPAWAAALDPPGRAMLIDRYWRPRPRNAFAAAVARHAHGAMDVSDGLVGDCAKMLAASGVGGRLQLERVPLSDAARRAMAVQPSLLDIAVTGGDDYEILLSASPGDISSLQEAGAAVGVAVTVIGSVEAGSGLAVSLDGRPHPLGRSSYSHF